MGKFLRGFALAYAIIVGLLILWSWCAVLASLHEPRELLTGPEWVLYVACLPASHVATSLFEWADSFPWRFGDVIALSALGVFQAAALQVLTRLVPKGRGDTEPSSSAG
jgi:O-antigen/teichoic acid export membrane protein